jgi:hypothetical protein
MTELDVKHALERYHDLRLALQATERQLDALNAKRFKVGGSVIRIPENAEPIDHRITTNLVKLERLEKDRERYRYYVGLGDDFIRVLEPKLQAMVVDKYVKGIRTVYLCETYGYAKSSIIYIIDRAVKMYVEKN